MKNCCKDCYVNNFAGNYKRQKNDYVDRVKSENIHLSDLKVGMQGIIVEYDKALDDKMKRRLLELGFVVGEKVKIENTSIMKDVLLVAVRGCLMSVRREILNFIYVLKDK